MSLRINLGAPRLPMNTVSNFNTSRFGRLASIKPTSSYREEDEKVPIGRKPWWIDKYSPIIHRRKFPIVKVPIVREPRWIDKDSPIIHRRKFPIVEVPIVREPRWIVKKPHGPISTPLQPNPAEVVTNIVDIPVPPTATQAGMPLGVKIAIGSLIAGTALMFVLRSQNTAKDKGLSSTTPTKKTEKPTREVKAVALI